MYSGKAVVFGQIDCIMAKVVVIRRKLKVFGQE